MAYHQKKIDKNPYPVAQMAISRRRFLERSITAIAGISIFGMYAYSGSLRSKKVLRVIAYNVLKCTGWPSDKVNEKDQIPTRIAQELARYSPDIINFSESPNESVVSEIAKQLAMNYVRFPSAGNWPGTLFTRFKIVDYTNVPIVSGKRPEDLFTRHWGKATLQLSNNESIIVNSAHLFPHDTPEAREIRQREISEILRTMQKDLENDRSIIVMGDLNHTPDMPEYSQWMNAGLVDTFTVAGKGDGLTVMADEPKRRIDYILAHGAISKHIIESQSLFEGAFRTNPSDPESFALSDHLPQFAEFGLDYIGK